MRFFLAALALAAAACGQGDAITGNRAEQSRVDFAPPAAPIELTGRLVDSADVLDLAAEQLLTQRLAALEAQTSDQIVVVTVPTLGGRTIEQYSLDLADRWGVGNADLDNGVLLVVAPNERKVRIEVGLGLEGLLTDAEAAKIIQMMLPAFREAKLEDGIAIGVDAVDHLLRSDTRRPQPKQAEPREES